MIVKANVKYNDGHRGDEWFLVRFDHSPVKNAKKRHRRIGLCTIFYLTDKPDYIGGESFASRICGEKKKFFVTSSKIVCSEKDNYVKAFARNVTLKKALTSIIEMQSNGELTWDFSFDNDTFKTFITTLNTSHPHGLETAMKLLKDSNYRASNKH